MKTLIAKIDFKDILVRAGKTFIQAALAVLVAALSNGLDITDKEALYALGIASLSAGISAVMNTVKDSLK